MHDLEPRSGILKLPSWVPLFKSFLEKADSKRSGHELPACHGTLRQRLHYQSEANGLPPERHSVNAEIQPNPAIQENCHRVIPLFLCKISIPLILAHNGS